MGEKERREYEKRKAAEPSPLHAYDTDEMNDPLVRCDSCSKLVHRAYIAKFAGCNHCGNKRFKTAVFMQERELRDLRDGRYDLGIKVPLDEAFLDIFSEPQE